MSILTLENVNIASIRCFPRVVFCYYIAASNYIKMGRFLYLLEHNMNYKLIPNSKERFFGNS